MELIWTSRSGATSGMAPSLRVRVDFGGAVVADVAAAMVVAVAAAVGLVEGVVLGLVFFVADNAAGARRRPKVRRAAVAVEVFDTALQFTVRWHKARQGAVQLLR